MAYYGQRANQNYSSLASLSNPYASTAPSPTFYAVPKTEHPAYQSN